MMSDDDKGEHVKEVYARFGLAVYCVQVLEHGLVNAFLVLKLIPSRRHLARSREEWEAEVDAFMDRHFEATMGRMMKNLRDVTRTELENPLHDALRRRNWLIHDFFRERRQEKTPDPFSSHTLSTPVGGFSENYLGQECSRPLFLLRQNFGRLALRSLG
jgi:hypothetical protein